MRFMMMVKSSENAGAPPQELMEAINKLTVEQSQAGKLVAAGGLAPTAMSSRVRLCDGKLTVTDGPFVETKEVVGGFAIMNANSKDEAIEFAKTFLNHVGEGECELRQLFE